MKNFYKYFLFSFVLFSIFVFNTKAITSPVSRGNVLFNNSTWYSQYGYWGVDVSVSGTSVNASLGCDLDDFSCVNLSAYVLDVCSQDSISVSRFADYGASCDNSCFTQNFILKDMYSSCKTNDGNYGFQYRLYLPVSKWDVGSGNTRLWSVDDTINIKAKNYFSLVTIFGVYYTDENVTAPGYDFSIINNQIKDTNKKLDDTNKKLDDTNKKLDDTNKKLDDVKGAITSEENPKLEGLKNSAGWLPAGPLDSILNLPLSFLNNLSSNLSKTCQPVSLPLPYVDQTLNLPCLSSIYSQIEGLDTWITSIGVIASVFILFTYLINLYKWVDDTLTFRENHYIDNWGGM
jgi:hypothetical protein